MNRVLAVLNLGGRSVTRKSRDSFHDASRRWGARYVEVTKALEPKRHHFWQKMLVHRLFGPHDRVLQLDADMLIRADAPSPFPLVPVDHLGLVRCNPGFGPWIGLRHKAIRFWADQLGVPPIDVYAEYTNSGFMLYSGAAHKALFESVYEDGRRVRYSHKLLPEQTILALRVHHERFPMTWLPFLFNTCGVQRNPLAGVGTCMRSFIYHFSGGAKWAMRHTDWQVIRPIDAVLQSLINRLPDGSLRGAQLGVAQGILSATLLSHLPQLHLTMVGRWRGEGYVNATDPQSGRTQARRNRDFESAFRETEFARSRRLLKDDSRDGGTGAVQDHTLDFVFIGGRPGPEQLQEMVWRWRTKLTHSGLICGQFSRHCPPDARQTFERLGRQASLTLDINGGDAWFLRSTR